MKLLHAITCVVILALSASCIGVELERTDRDKAEISAEAPQPAETESARWQQTSAADFSEGTHFKTKVVEVGDGAVTLDNAREGTFTSSTKEAQFAFNAIGAVQNSRIPSDARVEIEVRVSGNGKDWSDWIAVHAEAPVQDKKDDAVSQVVAVKSSRYLQFRAILSASGDSPVLGDVAITYINSGPGPNLEQAKKAPLPKAAGQPTIISREGWGANEKYRLGPNGKEIWPTEVRKPEKIVIHHTLTPNDEANPPASVRAVYYYHAVTLGWGDIGYNYLIDSAGHIYEGRRGDGAVAGHSYGHNYGSIGIAVLGNYLNSDVPEPARKSLIDLLAWLTEKHGIDPRGKSFFVDRELPNISGHKDANETSCPGTYLYARIVDFRRAAHEKVPPSAISIESPAEGASLFEAVPVKISQQDKWPLSKAEYFVDDKPMGQIDAPIGTWRLDPAKVGEGQHTLKVVVTNSLEKQSSATRTFNVGKPPAATWYFAEGSTNTGFQTWVLLMNANLVPAQVTLTTFDEAGKTERRNVQVAPKSRLNVSINEFAPNRAVGIKVEADQVIYAERAVFFGHDAHTSVGSTSLSQTWYFAEGSTESSFETWLFVANPSDVQVKLKVTYYKTDGSLVAKDYSVRPTARFNIWVNKEVPGTALAMKIEADAPVVAERAMYFDGGRGGHNTLGAPETSKTWYFAEGAGGAGFNTWILLLNPNAEPTQVGITFLRENGSVEKTSMTVPPRSRTNVWVNKLVAAGGVATRIQSDRPIIAERSMYWAAAKAGHNTVGATAPANQWFLPEGSTAAFNEWVLLMNPNSEPAKVTLTFLDEKGNATVKQHQVPANARLNVLVNQAISSTAVSTLVQSDRAIVVERSSYFADNKGGTNSMGIPR